MGKSPAKDKWESVKEKEGRNYTTRCGSDTCERRKRWKDWVGKMSRAIHFSKNFDQTNGKSLSKDIFWMSPGQAGKGGD